MVTSQIEIFRKVQNVVVEALGVEEDEVTSDARLTEDLGAESIDYLDIAFHLERTFGITIDSSDLILSNVMSDPQYVQEGRITSDGLIELRRRLPQVNFDALEQNRDVNNLLSVFTVDALVRFVRSKLDR